MIESYSFGRMVVDGQTYTSDLIILPDRILPSWWRKSGHHVCLEDLTDIIPSKLEILVIGTGFFGLMKVDPDISSELKSKEIILITNKTKEAVKKFNNLSTSKKTAGAFHLTC